MDSIHESTSNEKVEAQISTSQHIETQVPPLSASRNKPLSDDEETKVQKIINATETRNWHALGRLAASPGGFIDDEVRRIVWPLVLGVEPNPNISSINWKELPVHREEGQVELDVNRSFVYYPTDESDKRIDARKQELSNVITETLRRHPLLCYFQGYHDIVQVLLLVLGAEAAPAAAARLSLLRIRDFMLPTMTGALSHLQLLPAILKAADAELFDHLSETAPFYFALPATLTLYAHEIQEYGDIARLFDYLLTNEAVVSIYLYATIILSRKQELLSLEADEHDMLHSILSKLPKPLDLDALITSTSSLHAAHPPNRLRGFAWYQISSNSVLKTTRDPHALAKQTLRDGERFFERHAADIKTQEVRQKQLERARVLAKRYRRPALATGTAVLAALLALYLGKSGGGASLESVAGLYRAGLVLQARAAAFLHGLLR
ncbi:hypothetical protein MBLNU13_g06112t1 [Cladosporium sp. NU13]